jgi:hypothetical protein
MPDDPFIVDMDPVQKIWMYENWLADQNDKAELAKNHAYLLASFSHPDAVKQLLGKGNVYESTDEEFEESTRMIKEINSKLSAKSPEHKRRKKRRIIQG